MEITMNVAGMDIHRVGVSGGTDSFIIIHGSHKDDSGRTKPCKVFVDSGMFIESFGIDERDALAVWIEDRNTEDRMKEWYEAEGQELFERFRRHIKRIKVKGVFTPDRNGNLKGTTVKSVKLV
jgi:phosphoribosylformimino-5-aminoimidazole carboxamide ribonucleotide (ProFAR) isomerase